jgi:hypothetical protein
MIQIKRGAATVATVNQLSSSNMSKAVMGEEQITLVWESPAFVSFSLGDYVTVEGSNWTLNQLPTVKKLSSKLWQYNAVFQSTKYELLKAMYLLFDNTETLPAGEFPLTGTADTFMELLVANINRVAAPPLGVGGSWSVGDVIENTDYKNLTFSNEDCLSVLTRLADEFDTEYHVANHTIHLKRISTEREVTLEYGSTLYDIERSSVDSSNVCTRLYPFGSTRNLASNYRGGNSPLRIPVANGNYIENNVSLYGIIEMAKTFEDIYPRLSSGGAGAITSVGNEFTFYDTALDFDVNDYLLDGTPAKVHFNTGECAGYDFEIASYNHAARKFIIIANTQENDFTLPTADIKPAAGDKYVLIDIAMPPAYLAAAEAELLAKAQEYIGQNSAPKVAYKTTFSAIYARQNLQSVECGDTVTVYDEDMGINEQIRIVKLQKGLTDYWNVQFDLANTVTATRLERIEGTVATVENTMVVANQRINRNNLRSYQNTKELQSMVFDPDGYFNPESIKPLSIETSMLSVGAKSQSFQLSSLLQPNYENNPQVLAWSAGVLAHFTIVDDAITEWVISEGSITITGDNQTAALYIYARCSRAGTTGDIYLSATATKFDADATYYFFLLGVLHTPVSSVRGVSLTYGQTTINGQFIKTGVISSIDGATYFNLNTGEIGGNIKFRASDNSLKSVEQGLGETLNTSLEYGNGKNLLPQAEFQGGLAECTIGATLAALNVIQSGVNYTDWTLGGNTDINNKQGLNTVFLRNGAYVANTGDNYSYFYFPRIHGIQGGKKYIASIYVGLHDAVKADIIIEFYNSSGTWLNYYHTTASSVITMNEAFGGSNINGYKRIYIAGAAHQDATQCAITVRKYATAVGMQSSWLFACRPMVEQVADQTTKPGVWTPYASGAEVAESKALLADIASDGKLTPNEKQIALREWQEIQTEFNAVNSEAGQLGLDGTELDAYFDFVNDYNNLNAYLNTSVISPNTTPLLSDMATTSDIVAATFNQKFYYCRGSIDGQRYANSMAIKVRADSANYLKAAMATTTDINGGLMATALLRMKDAANNIHGGMSGLPDNIGFWTGGTYEQALADAVTAFKAAKQTGALDRKDGAGHRAKGNFAWDTAGNVFFKGIIEALSGGKFGQFSIQDQSIVSEAIKFSFNENIEDFVNALITFGPSISKVSSWDNGTDHAYTQELVLTDYCRPNFDVNTTASGSSKSYTCYILNSKGETVFTKTNTGTAFAVSAISLGVGFLPPERYTIHVTSTSTGANTAEISGTADTINTVVLGSRFKIGKNGFYCFPPGTTKRYIYYREDVFKVQVGNYGLRIDSTGIYKAVNNGNDWQLVTW